MLAGIIVAGWDKKYGGQVFQVPLGGMVIRSKYAIGGSGSSYVQGHIRENFRENMSQEDCLEFVKKSNCPTVYLFPFVLLLGKVINLFSFSAAVFHAMFYDGSSGGVCRTGIITKDGIKRQTHFAPPEGIPRAATSTVPSVSGIRA